MLHDFLLWWGQQLKSLVPEGLIGESSTRSDAVLIAPVASDGGSAGMVELLLRREGATSSRGRYALDPQGVQRLAAQLADPGFTGPILLDLPPGSLLEKEMVFPSTIEGDLDRVLRYEMDGETPFSVDEVYWDWSVDGRDRALRKISVTLALLPREGIDDLLALLHGQGITPQGLSTVRADGRKIHLPLVHQGKTTAPPLFLQRRLLSGACAFLAVMATIVPFAKQSLVLSSLESRVAAAQPAAAEVQELRARIEGTAGGGDVIQAERARFSDPLDVLAALTDAMPDDTFVTDLLLKGHKVTVAGQSGSATRLISILAGTQIFHDPSFSAPVTRLGPGSDALEVFSIGTEVRQEP
jgi:general secretion pathway protein L